MNLLLLLLPWLAIHLLLDLVFDVLNLLGVVLHSLLVVSDKALLVFVLLRHFLSLSDCLSGLQAYQALKNLCLVLETREELRIEVGIPIINQVLQIRLKVLIRVVQEIVSILSMLLLLGLLVFCLHLHLRLLVVLQTVLKSAKVLR